MTFQSCSSPQQQLIERDFFLEMCGSIGAAGLLAGQPLDTGPSQIYFHPLNLIFIFILDHLT
jgi:hypothetical protein